MATLFCAHAPEKLCRAGRIASLINSQGIKDHHIAQDINPGKLAQLIIGSLEGALLISRLQKERQALRDAKEHLDNHLDHNVRARNPRDEAQVNTRRRL